MVIDWGPIGLVGFLVLFFAGSLVAAVKIMGRQNAGFVVKSPDEEVQDLAKKRGDVFVPPRLPRDLSPIFPWDLPYDTTVPSASVEFRTHDAEGILFRAFFQRHSSLSHHTFISMNTRAVWPRFELYVTSRANVDPQSFIGGIAGVIGMVEKSWEAFRGLHAVPIPERPGSQLFVADPAAAQHLMPIVLPFAQSGRITWIAGDHHRLVLRTWEGASEDAFIDDASSLAATAAQSL